MSTLPQLGDGGRQQRPLYDAGHVVDNNTANVPAMKLTRDQFFGLHQRLRAPDQLHVPLSLPRHC